MDAYLDRRTFIRDVGKGVIGIAVGAFGLAGCREADPFPASSTVTTGATAASTTTTPTTAPATTEATTATTTAPTASLSVERVLLGSVSAYLLVRGTEVALVDTGTPGSEDAIAAALATVGLGWAEVGNVIVTHRHPDHAGSLPAVADAANQAVLGTGTGDMQAMSASRPVEGYEDGDVVFGLQIVATPGHTPGHIAVYDPATSILFAGDAINGAGSGVATMVDGVGGPNPRFSPDMDGAIASVRKLAALQPNTIFFGHGDPKQGGAAAALAGLADQL